MLLVFQASLGESKNKAETVPLYVNANGKKLVLGTLSHQNCPQLSFDLVFDQDFELSHNWKNGSVYFLGYKTFVPEEGDDEFDMSSEEKAKRSFLWLLQKMEKLKQIKRKEPSNSKKTEEDESDEMSMDESSMMGILKDIGHQVYFLCRRKVEITDSLRRVHMYVDSCEKVTARYQLICASK